MVKDFEGGELKGGKGKSRVLKAKLMVGKEFEGGEGEIENGEGI